MWKSFFTIFNINILNTYINLFNTRSCLQKKTTSLKQMPFQTIFSLSKQLPLYSILLIRYFLSDAGTPAIPKFVFGSSVTNTLTLSRGASKVSTTVSVIFSIRAFIFSGGLPSIRLTWIIGNDIPLSKIDLTIV